eukprot:m.31421 g.31421  ORF g.31421 m.31421 type:complete len:53 (+) comp8315_c0_seq3:832-990(+)
MHQNLIQLKNQLKKNVALKEGGLRVYDERQVFGDDDDDDEGYNNNNITTIQQ